ncbi:C4BPA protein, partial [Psophia crepitans]|nr:C4BPA protein [Psophia crepitans]
GDCGQPPRFAFAEAPAPLKESYAVGAKLRYRCRPGYTMAGGKSPNVICLSTSLWSSDPDFCIGRSCGPPDITNGNFDYTTNLLFGATITYTCNLGYRLVGKQTAQCILRDNEVRWDTVPECDIIPCLPPPAIENTKPINRNGDFTFGMAVTYDCVEGFALIGDATIHCTMDNKFEGVWSGPGPECKVVRCKNPEVQNGRKLSGFGTGHTYKNTVTFECNPGYLLNGSSVVTCEADNTWKPALPTCDPTCGPAPRFPFAELTRPVSDTSLAGTTLTYRCKPGYAAADGKSPAVTCLSNRTWAADPDFCMRQQCPPPTIENGEVIAPDFLFETVVTFICHPGYKLKESSTAKCVALGDGVGWDTASPHCENDIPPVGQLPDATCEEPPTIANGMHNGTKGVGFVQGSVVVYKCKDGFTLFGTASIHCKEDHQHHGVWSKPTPECRGGASVILVGIFPLLLAMLVMN